MMRAHWFLAMALTAACDDGDTGDDDDDDDDDTPNDTDTDTSGADQIPPQGYAAIDPWLDAGEYTDWNCEAAPHAGAGVSPHGMNRICSNDLASTHTTGEFPIGAASVKELYDEAGTTVVGYAVTSKVSTGGAESWYWYEQVPPGTDLGTIVVDANGVVADDLGDAGQAATVCVTCHVGAPNDYVWVQVP
jgi:hypothetical protein